MRTVKDFFEKLASESEYRPSWDVEKNRVRGEFGSIDVPANLSREEVPDRDDWYDDSEYEIWMNIFKREEE